MAKGWNVLGTVSSGEDALAQVPRLNPDLVLMDVVMPGMGGIAAVRKLRQDWAGIMIMISGYSQETTRAIWDALDAGANDFLPKPEGRNLLQMVDMITVRYQALSHDALPDRKKGRQGDFPRAGQIRGWRRRLDAVVIGASTGGPQTLSRLLRDWPGVPTIPLLIVQHMPAGFTHSFAQRLGERAGFSIQEAPCTGDSVGYRDAPVVVACGGRHLRVGPDRCWSAPGSRRNGVIPSLDVTLEDAAEVFGAGLGAIILTGMGEDGCVGAQRVHDAGGWVVAESADSALVWGMPRAVIMAGLADAVGTVEEIRGWLWDITMTVPGGPIPS